MCMYIFCTKVEQNAADTSYKIDTLENVTDDTVVDQECPVFDRLGDRGSGRLRCPLLLSRGSRRFSRRFKRLHRFRLWGHGAAQLTVEEDDRTRSAQCSRGRDCRNRAPHYLHIPTACIQNTQSGVKPREPKWQTCSLGLSGTESVWSASKHRQTSHAKRAPYVR